LLDCEDVTHGCFANVDSCGGGETATTTTATTAGTTTSITSTNVVAPSPTVTATNASPASESLVQDETYKPSDSPTLPPWTNAPFVPYRGPKRDKIVIGYYVRSHGLFCFIDLYL
jgi:hypothetical protein